MAYLPFQDDFTTLDLSGKWNGGSFNTGTISVVSGQLNIKTNASSTAYHGIDSGGGNLPFDMTGSCVTIQVVNAGNQALNSYELYPLQVFHYTGGAQDANNNLQWYINTNNLVAYKTVSSTLTQVYTTTYSSSTHKYLRIREQGGTTYWDYSTDGITWTTAHSEANPIAVTSLQVEIAAGTYASEASSSTAILDNLNIVPIGVVQTAFASDSNGITGSISKAFTNSVIKGNSVIAIIGTEGSGSANTNITSFTSSSPTNTWSKVLDVHDASAEGIQVWNALSANAGTTTVSFSDGFSPSALALYEVQGLASSSAVDLSFGHFQVGPNGSSGTAPASSQTANEIIFGIVVQGSNTGTAWTGDSGYTYVDTAATGITLMTEYKAVTAIQSPFSIAPTGGTASFYNYTYVLSFADTPVGKTKTQSTVARIQNTAVTKTQSGISRIQQTRNRTGKLDQSQTSLQSSFSFGTTAQQKLAIPFTPTVTKWLHSISLLMGNSSINAQADQIRVNIYSDSAGSPGSLLQTADNTFDLKKNTYSTLDDQVFYFANSNLTLTSGIQYWIVLDRTGSLTSNGYNASGLNTGSAKYYNGTSWVAANVSPIFKEYYVINPQLITSRILNNAVTKTQSVIAHLTAFPTRTQTIHAAIRGTKSKTQSIISQISTSFNKEQNLIARLVVLKTKSQTAISRIVNVQSKTQPFKARISEPISALQTVVGRIQKAFSKTQTISSKIQNTVIKTQSSIAAIIHVGNKTQTLTASIVDYYKASTLQDTFDGTSYNAAKWSPFASLATYSQNNAVTFTLAGSQATSNYSGYSSTHLYDLTNSSASVEVLSVPNTATQAEMYLTAYKDANNKVTMIFTNGSLILQKIIGGVKTNFLTLSYNSGTQRFIRIREQAGTVYFDTSSDGVIWTNQSSLADPFSLKNVVLEFGAGTWQSETSPGTASFDNFNVVPVAPVPKTYIYKVYNGGTYLGNLPNILSDFSYSQDINTAGSQITITVGMSADTSGQSFTQHLLTESSDFIDTESSIRLVTEGASQLIGLGGSGTLIENGNRIKVYEYSSYYPNGKLMFSGQVQRWEASFGGDNGQESIDLLAYSDGYDLDNYILLGNPYTSDVTQSAQNISDTLNDADGRLGHTWNYYGQTWTTGSSVTNLGAIDVYLKGTASVTLKVYSSVPADPSSGTALGITTVSVDTAGVAAWVQFAFASPLSVGSNTSYFFVLEPATNESIIMYFDNANPYAGGQAYQSIYTGTSGGSWSALATSDLAFKTFYSSGSTTAIYSSVDPTTGMLKPFMDIYKGQGGYISYTSTSIDTTGLSLSYTFNTNTVYEGIQKVRELAPDGYYYYVDTGTDILYMKQTSTSPDIILTKGKHISGLTVVATIETMHNLVYFSGGLVSGSNLFKVYKDTTSIGQYGQRLDRLSDNRVTLSATADALGNSDIAENSSEQYQTEVTVVDGTMDITLLKPGQVIGFNGFGTFIDNLQAQVVRVDYTPEQATLTLGILPKRLNPAFERITRGLIAEQTINNPSTPS